NMCEVQKLLDGLCQTFGKFKELRRLEMVRILNQVRCCECGHRMRLIHARERKAICAPEACSKKRIRVLLGACFGLLLLLVVYIIHVGRRFNHVKAYGSCACGSTFFYTFNDCDVLY
ncbi:hypothetical protein KR009_001385, partial [Drosophila setifemur]